MKYVFRVSFAYLVLSLVFLVNGRAGCAGENATVLAGTRPLATEGDLASAMVDGIDRFLLDQLERSVAQRESFYERDFSSAAAYQQSLEPNRRRLAHILGVRDERVPFDSPELVATRRRPALVGRGQGYEVSAVRWPACGDVWAEGLLLEPVGRAPLADVVALADADQTPEQLAGLTEGVAPEAQFARRLAESGCRVLMPTLVDRRAARRGNPPRGATLTNREYIYRSAYELGRHLIGYELQQVLAGVDWFTQESGGKRPVVGVAGYGEGGMLALYAAALDPRIDAALVSGYFDCRQQVWQEPLDRNVFGLLQQFGDAELAAMVAPRALVVEAAAGPQLEIPPGTGGGPGRLQTPKLVVLRQEVERVRKLTGQLHAAVPVRLVESGGGRGPFGSEAALGAFLDGLAPGAKVVPVGQPPEVLCEEFDPQSRQQRLIHQLDRHNQWLLAESPYVRRDFLDKLDTSSVKAFEKSAAAYRRLFYDEIIGRFECALLDADPRTRQVYDTPKYTGYEVVLDVFPEVFAYGILLVPKDIAMGERRPAVVCQHGLEGRPRQTLEGDHRAYHDFAAKLAERGFVVFAPQNPYIFGDRFRTLQRKANPLGKTLFSIIVPQHQQIVDWLQSLPQVDPQRIGFYGLSYGGKTAMRVPALVTDYALSICSGDFNDWIWKNASTRARYSYMWTGEYEIFEFDLGRTFNYSEMAALIAPRPFMVERGHFDAVAPDERVALEFAKVRHLYQAKLGIGERAEIEWFVGPHAIHGQGTFAFLHRHLKWPDPSGK